MAVSHLMVANCNPNSNRAIDLQPIVFVSQAQDLGDHLSLSAEKIEKWQKKREVYDVVVMRVKW